MRLYSEFADWFHLLGNLYFLYVFGDNVEHIFGHLRFCALVVLAALAGALLQAYATTAIATPVIGASGAITGVIAAYLWIFPRARLLQTIPFVFIQVKIPAWVYVVTWLGVQVAMALFSAEVDFAWFTHIGGFIVGAALSPFVIAWRRRRVAASVRVPSAAFFLNKSPDEVRHARHKRA